MRLVSIVPGFVRTPLGRLKRGIRASSGRTRKQRDKLLAKPGLSPEDLVVLHSISTEISAHDTMYTGDGVHYFEVGLSALKCIEDAIKSGGVREPRSILDLPCGHARVLRFLIRRFPEASFTACDLDRDGVDFCARTLGVKGVYSTPDLDKLDLGKGFDLIWCGSLATHLSAAGIRSLFNLFARQLAPAGLAVFTTHGDFVAERMATADFDYMLSAEQISQVLTDHQNSGFGYADYQYGEGYGVSLTSSGWIRNELQAIDQLKEVYFKARAWDHHHDVYGFVRA